MKTNRINLYENGACDYPEGFGFVPNLVTYLHEDKELRPCVVVVPGGGYRLVSPTEGEIVAKAFYEMGYHAAVLTYTTNPLNKTPLMDRPMREVQKGLMLLRERAEELRIDGDRLVLCGFSAGAHLCGTVCVHGEIRPAAAILSYPVISSGPCAHRDSFTALLGEDASPEDLRHYSLETQVTAATPPCFLWQTATDDVVPVENSILFAEALRAAGVPYEHHVFSRGPHGLSLANEVWASGQYGKPYPYEQLAVSAEAVSDGRISVSPDREAWLKSEIGPDAKHAEKQVWPEIAVWPQLADAFLRTIL